MKRFIDDSRSARELKIGGLTLSDTFRDIIMEQAVEASKISYVVHTITNAYVKISNDHIMDRIACLGKLLPLDPATDMRKIVRYRNELHEGAKKAQTDIQHMLAREKREFDQKIEERIQRIEREVNAVLPPIDESKIKEIKESVEKGTKLDDAELNEQVDDLI